jgi:hypothetical protein
MKAILSFYFLPFRASQRLLFAVLLRVCNSPYYGDVLNALQIKASDSGKIKVKRVIPEYFRQKARIRLG